MNITYNGVESPEKMVTFTEIPNILKLEEYIAGVKANVKLEFEGDLRATVTADSQYYITFLGETITSVMNPSNNNNKRFYISGDEDCTAMNVTRALRNCSSISAEFDIIHSGSGVILVAKTIGQKWNNINTELTTNIPNSKLTISTQNGSADSVFYKSKIDVDVYTGETTDQNNYVTTLEKNWYGDSCSFDMSPLLTTISEYGKTQPYYMNLQLIRDDGEWQYIGQVSGNTTIGYHANQSEKFLIADSMKILSHIERGTSNQMILYTYSNVIPYSILCGNSGWSTQVSVKNSANVEIWSTSFTQHHYSENLIQDKEYAVPMAMWSNAFYVDITVGSDTIRFNVIRPLKATEYFQRVYWRNEYGGISFFDFTGQRTESDNVDIETYEKNVFDYYETDEFERKKIYSNSYKKSVSLKSHLMEEDGKWIFNSLMRSKKVWTEVNGKTYYIIPTSISVDEDQTYNNIFTAKLQYEYSDI